MNYNPKNSLLEQTNGDEILEEIENIKTDISSLKNNIKNNISADISFIKKELISMNNQIKDIKNLMIKHFHSNNLNDNDNNDLINTNNNKIPTLFNNTSSKKKISERNVILSFNDKDFLIKVNDYMTLEEFISIAENNLKIIIKDNIQIHYFNAFGIKKLISNEIDFSNTLIEKVFKYYFTEKNSLKTKKNLLGPKKNIYYDYNFLISSKFEESNISTGTNKYISKSPDLKNNDNKKTIKHYQKEIESFQSNVKEAMDHFSSVAFISDEVKLDDYINSAVYVSDLMKKININDKKNHPEKLINPKKILNYPGLINNSSNKEDYNFILSLIYKTLKEKGINTAIYKENQGSEKLDGASLQYLFSGLTEKKKLEISFDLGSKTNKTLLKKGKELTNFISEWKIKLSNKLNAEVNDIILVNPKEKNGMCSLDLFQNKSDININIKKLKSFDEIKNIEEKPLIEACQLNLDIFDPAGDNQDGGWGIGEKRGGEDYLPPIGWNAYGLKVKGKYDFGNDTWLNYMDKDGVFAVAYFGLSNIYGNKSNLKHFFKLFTTLF